MFTRIKLAEAFEAVVLALVSVYHPYPIAKLGLKLFVGQIG